jgi:hypothetical protein
MSTKRVLTIVLVASALLLVLGVGSRVAHTARALPPAQAGVSVPYSGSLADEAGQPVADGVYAFTFALYEAESGEEPLWTEAQEGVTVQGGAFTALLGSATPLPKETLDSGARWLEVSVRGPGEAGFTLLSPRQELSAVAPASLTSPSAGPACAHDHFGESWTGDSGTAGLIVDNNNTTTGDGIRGYTSAPGVNMAGLFGVNDNAAAGGPGTYGYSARQAGVYGIGGAGTVLTYPVGGPSGVYGTGPTGVSGYAAGASAGDGVVGTTTASSMSGVYGYATNSYGVTGRSTNTFGVQAVGGDSSWSDQIGDLVLGGNRGEIFSFGWAMNLFSNGDVYVDLDNDNNDTNSCLYIYDGGNNIVSQHCENGAKSAVLQTEGYGQRAVYTIESPEVWLEDFGTASLADGEATVAFESIFAETVNLEMDYHVFVTPLCQEPVLLFVTAKTSTGFTVQGVTLDNQPSSCDFDYRVVARRLGLEDLRLEPVSANR